MGPAVDRAGAGQDVAAHTGLFGAPRDMCAAAVIDAIGHIRIEVTGRIIGKRREIHHRVDTFESGRRKIANIILDDGEAAEANAL